MYFVRSVLLSLLFCVHIRGRDSGCQKYSGKISMSPARSALKFIQLCLLAKSQDVREFSLAAVLGPLLNGISILETEGVFIESLGKTIFGTVAYMTVDRVQCFD